MQSTADNMPGKGTASKWAKLKSYENQFLFRIDRPIIEGNFFMFLVDMLFVNICMNKLPKISFLKHFMHLLFCRAC